MRQEVQSLKKFKEYHERLMEMSKMLDPAKEGH